tara:strand:- start:662 stop:1192 length:531 start_codon:yes stop_codon:yes gene_type:complete
MKATLFFLFNHGGELYIVDNTKINDVPKPRELIFRASQIEIIRERALYMSQPIVMDSARKRTAKHSPEGLERIREAKLGSNHPAVVNGRSPDFRDKVSRTMRGTRIGENNPMYGRRHTKETRQKMHEAAMNKERRRWVCSPDGVTTTIPVSEPKPEGWQWGRHYDPYRPDTEPLSV